MGKGFVEVTVLIDWGCAHRIVPHEIVNRKKGSRKKGVSRSEDADYAARCFRALQENVLQALYGKYGRNYYAVSIRLYNGWHQGMSETVEYKTISSVVGDISPRLDNVYFNKSIGYSYDLLCGGRSRIFNTLRRQENGKPLAQKMVDTSLVCDMLHLARTKKEGIVLVFTDDDDLVPGIITAEAWGASKFHIVTRRGNDVKCINVGGLVFRVEADAASSRDAADYFDARDYSPQRMVKALDGR